MSTNTRRGFIAKTLGAALGVFWPWKMSLSVDKDGFPPCWGRRRIVWRRWEVPYVLWAPRRFASSMFFRTKVNRLRFGTTLAGDPFVGMFYDSAEDLFDAEMELSFLEYPEDEYGDAE